MTPGAPTGGSAAHRRWAWPWAGFALVLLLWWAGTAWLTQRTPVATAFAPWPTLQALLRLLASGELWWHVWLSLQRVGVGLLLGILAGLWRPFAAATTPVFQFLRMVSPLSWMPLAVMVLGVGNAPVYFLLGFAAVWPVMLNTAAGVAQLDPNWLLLARSLSATRRETVWRVVLPGITAHILTGVRLAIGIIWIVLVPAEMLGVSAGLGYFILDTRDRLAYDELMAAIVLVGALGFALDWLARALASRWRAH